MRNKPTNKNKMIFLIASIVFVLILFVLGTASIEITSLSSSSWEETFSFATTAKPERLTELYFESHHLLPGEIRLNEEINFEFTICNLEGEDLEYIYEVFMLWQNQKTIIGRDSIFIKKNESETINQKFLLDEWIAGRIKIVVNLVNKNQQIHFWVDMD
ncbi:MAG: hypothetical protein WCV43_07970 [Candidatus Caldatribacteriota bacterium]|jgi:hypothetical protein|nr:hypothetical protein [Atribacterota bacterium]MDD3640705.1 hypothetical protein [Atribacterota bacterium]MDD4288868.1 hypothetical protein [Atribacterota bacterium]MDI9597379.1 hypothetical protein [Atribacterota bacterium]